MSDTTTQVVPARLAQVAGYYDASYPPSILGPKPPKVPRVTGTNPVTRVIAPTDDVTLHVIGSGFTPDSVISFGAVDETTVYVSGTELTTIITGSLFTGIDPAVPVQVSNEVDSNTVFFAFQNPAADNTAVLVSLNRTEAIPGQQILLAGTGFGDDHYAFLAGIALTTQRISDTEIVTSIPSGQSPRVDLPIWLEHAGALRGVTPALPITIIGAATVAGPEPYDPGAHTVEEVKAYIGDHPDEATSVLQAETAGKNRTTLVAWLEEQPG